MIDNGLNPDQLKAVNHLDNPLLVLAGPGSGKTRVITYRIANMIQNGILPHQILALTFTNKAAGEMGERVAKIVEQGNRIWISTFHSFCARLLRRSAHHLGYEKSFSIYDSDDQKKALKHVMDQLSLDTPMKPQDVRSLISHYKNKNWPPEKLLEGFPDSRRKAVALIYRQYQNFLKQNNAMDFDDLLLKTLLLLQTNEEERNYWQERFHYILIDEFQDTNFPQYELAKILAAPQNNICATGDPDQSIYSWRGANINNILSFEKDFPGTKLVKLEQNYRSTQRILKAASSVIANNRQRKEKSLWSHNPQGDPVRIISAYDNREEAQCVCRDLQYLQKQGHSLKDIVIFYRTNSQSRALETELRNRAIPYAIIGALEFYQRAEVKDLIAYLRVLANPGDDLSLLRIINVPARSIGKTTCRKLVEIARERGISLFEALHSDTILNSFSSRAKKALERFGQMMLLLRQQKLSSLHEKIQNVLKESGYLEYIQKQDISKEQERQANLEEFVQSAYEYEQMYPEGTLMDFLERIALISDADNISGDEDKITMMTLHAAKGLEFPIVFIVGLTEGILPHFRSESDDDLEEERRLMFVGMTRAKYLLTLSYSIVNYQQRNVYYTQDYRPSRFLDEIAKDVICEVR